MVRGCRWCSWSLSSSPCGGCRWPSGYRTSSATCPCSIPGALRGFFPVAFARRPAGGCALVALPRGLCAPRNARCSFASTVADRHIGFGPRTDRFRGVDQRHSDRSGVRQQRGSSTSSTFRALIGYSVTALIAVALLLAAWSVLADGLVWWLGVKASLRDLALFSAIAFACSLLVITLPTCTTRCWCCGPCPCSIRAGGRATHTRAHGPWPAADRPALRLCRTPLQPPHTEAGRNATATCWLSQRASTRTR